MSDHTMTRKEYIQCLEKAKEYALIQVQDHEGILRMNWKVQLDDLNEILNSLEEYC